MRWRVWITGYEGSYSLVEADTMVEAMTKGAKEQKASHTGEVYEINAVPETEDARRGLRRRLVRITQNGGIQWE